LVGSHQLRRHDDGNQNHNQLFPPRLYNPSSPQLYPYIVVINGSINIITDLSGVNNSNNNNGRVVLPKEEG
jgi:hypothetical protein